MTKKKPQYASKDRGHLVRIQILLSRKDYLDLAWWRKKTGKPKIDLIRVAIEKELAAEKKRLKKR